MQKHTKIYFDYFGYDISDWIPCEVCFHEANDIHHIDARGMGGTKSLDDITNLMALCRLDHLKYGDKEQYMEFLKERHKDIMETRI